ncbi:MAG: uroporphyrinogen-III synthase [Steroidobacteraceae bacterium]|jgi:uroporphyrinogen-III synthase|nr:uroporphyrinogen-III synthase [Steroidobacteraceae bacterium]
MAELAGLGVLVTRPEPQAEPLSRRLEALGARSFRFPAIEIRARDGRPALRASLGPVDRFDWVMFVSANAVRHGLFLLEGPQTPRLAAVGPATAAALEQAGRPVALVPASGFDSESLLASPEFARVRGQRVLIVRGDGGRELLADELRARGAEVVFAAVYERACAAPAPGAVRAVESAWAAGAIHVVTATSAELLRCLFEILGPDGRAHLQRTPLLAGGARIAQAAAAMGHEGERIVAAAADDASLVDALVKWRRHTTRP